MRSHVVDCANCGAPLGVEVAANPANSLVPCLYCGALLRFTSAEQAPAVEAQLGQELIDRARAAALAGGREEAIQLCVAEGRVSRAVAESAVDDLLRSVGRRVVFSQSLNALGWVIVLASVAAVAVGGLWLSRSLWGLVPLVLGGLNLLVLGRGVVTSLRAALAERGAAVIVHSVHVGPTGLSDGCQLYSLAVDVTPARGGAPFHARLVLPVKPSSLPKVQVGQTMPVRFERGGQWLRSAS